MKAYCKLLPYVEIDGAWTFTDSFIKGVYTKMEFDGDIQHAFLDGGVTSADDLVKRFKQDDIKVFIVPEGNEVKAVVWLSDFRQATAYAHFWVAREHRGPGSVAIAMTFLDEMLHIKNPDGEYALDVIFAYVSEENKGVVKLLHGMFEMSKAPGSTLAGKILDTIPNAMIDVYKGRKVNAVLGYAVRKEDMI